MIFVKAHSNVDQAYVLWQYVSSQDDRGEQALTRRRKKSSVSSLWSDLANGPGHVSRKIVPASEEKPI